MKLAKMKEAHAGYIRGSRVTPGTGLGRRQLRGHGHNELVGRRHQAGAEGRQGIAPDDEKIRAR